MRRANGTAGAVTTASGAPSTARPTDAARSETHTRAFRLFASPMAEPRARRATDLVVLVVAAALLVLVGVLTLPPGSVEAAVIEVIEATPAFLDAVWQIGFDLPALWCVVLVVLVVVRHRLGLLRDLALGGALGLGLAAVAAWLAASTWPGGWAIFGEAGPPAWYATPRLALTMAVVMTAAPHLTRPVRQLGIGLVVFGALSATMVGVATPTGAVAGLLAGVAAAAAIHLLFGSCGGRPGLVDVASALEELGIEVDSLETSAREPGGAFAVTGVDPDGHPLVVKVYGRDAVDDQVVSRLWRTLWYRGATSAARLGRLEQAEHEAFITLLAGRAGVPAHEVVTAGATQDGDALVVLRGGGRPLAELSSAELDDDSVQQLWDLLDSLHATGIAHHHVDALHLVMTGTGPTLVDFAGATAAARGSEHDADRAQLLVTLAALTGQERAVTSALEAIGPERVEALLPYVQPAAMTPYARRQARDVDLDLDDLRTATAAQVGVTVPALTRLRRVTVGGVLQVGILAVACFALISGLSGLDLADVWDEVQNAEWAWVAGGFVLAQLPRAAQAVSTRGASPSPLPFAPVYALQLAISYVNLAIPSSAARIAVNIRFFQRQGMTAATSVTVGAIDGLGGFVVQAMLLVSILLFSSASLDLTLDTSGLLRVVILVVVGVVVVAVGAAIVLVVRPAWRQALIARLRPVMSSVQSVLETLRSPRRMAMVLGGNLAAEVLFASALGAFARALGYDVGLGELLLINVSVSLLAGLLPIPGGIGVTEGGLTLGLVAAGVPEAAAFAIAIMQRIATFYLPPIWGFVAFRWLQRHGDL